MTALLVRVDDRLLHGQVAYGWERVLRPDRFLIIDDRAAADRWEREALKAGAGEGPAVDVMGVEAFLSASKRSDVTGRSIVLIRDLQTLERLCSAGLHFSQGVNLGGVHSRPGTREVLPYLFLTAAEEELLDGWLAAGCPLYAQDLPGAPRLEGEALRGHLRA